MKSILPLLIGAAPLLGLTAGATVTETFTTTKSLNADGIVSVSNTNGSIKVTGWDRSEVELVAIKEASSDKQLEGIEVRISSTPTRFAVETRTPDSSWWNWGRSASVRYELRVPKAAVIDQIESVNGSVELMDLAGRVRAETVNGSIRATGLTSDAALDTVNGSIRMQVSSLREGAKADCETVNGSIVLALPGDACAELRAETVNGSIRNDFGLPNPERRPGGGKFRGTLGSGSARVAASTVNGSIRFEKASVEPL